MPLLYFQKWLPFLFAGYCLCRCILHTHKHQLVLMCSEIYLSIFQYMWLCAFYTILIVWFNLYVLGLLDLVRSQVPRPTSTLSQGTWLALTFHVVCVCVLLGRGGRWSQATGENSWQAATRQRATRCGWPRVGLVQGVSGGGHDRDGDDQITKDEDYHDKG